MGFPVHDLILRLVIIFSMWGILSYFTLLFPQKFEGSSGDKEVDALSIAIIFAMFIGLALTAYSDDFWEGIGIELLGAYVTGLAIFGIDRRFTRWFDKNREVYEQEKVRKASSSTENMRQSIRKVRRLKKGKILK